MLVLLAMVGNVRAQGEAPPNSDDDGDDGGDDGDDSEVEHSCDIPGGDSHDCDENRAERRTRVDFSNRGFRMRSKAETGQVEDEIEIDFQGEDNRLEVDYRIKSENATSESTFRFRWRMVSLVEYVKAIGSMTHEFDPNMDLVCSRTPIRGDDFTWSSSQQNISNATVSVITATSDFVTVTNYVPGPLNSEGRSREFSKDNYVVTPRSFKFDISLTLQNYNWSANCTDSRIALVSLVKSAARVNEEDSTTISFGAAAITENAAAAGLFTWAPNVTINGTSTADVLITNLYAAVDSDDERDDDSSASCKAAVFAFDAIRPETVDWDPYLGALAVTPSSASILSIASAAIIAIVGIIF